MKFKYCGHGYKLDAGDTCFACYDAGDKGIDGWSAKTIPAAIEQYFSGERAILAADCCCSGSLTESVQAQADRIAYACLTSSSANEFSTGNWTFTEGLLDALRGEAYSDADDSQGITLAELANQIIVDMAFAEEKRTSFITTGAFNPNMVLAPSRRKTDARIGERVEVYTEGDWYKARALLLPMHKPLPTKCIITAGRQVMMNGSTQAKCARRPSPSMPLRKPSR